MSEVLKTRLKPGVTGRADGGETLLGGVIGRWKDGIKPLRFLTFRPVFMWVFSSVALLRCLFRERKLALFPSQVWCAESCLRTMDNIDQQCAEQAALGPWMGHYW